jgi:hypothetical protein
MCAGHSSCFIFLKTVKTCRNRMLGLKCVFCFSQQLLFRTFFTPVNVEVVLHYAICRYFCWLSYKVFTVTVRFKQKWECVDKFYYNSTGTHFLKINFLLHEFFYAYRGTGGQNNFRSFSAGW